MAPSDTPSSTPTRSGDRVNNIITIALTVGVLLVGVQWRRTHNPLRAWVRRTATKHEETIERPFRRCFGETDTASLHALSAAVRHGTIPAPFANCHGGLMTEAAVAPQTFVEALRDTPPVVYSLRDRERAVITRLSPTLRRLESSLPRDGSALTDAQRQSVADRLDDAVAEIDQEHQVFADLLHAAIDAAPPF